MLRTIAVLFTSGVVCGVSVVPYLVDELWAALAHGVALRPHEPPADSCEPPLEPGPASRSAGVRRLSEREYVVDRRRFEWDESRSSPTAVHRIDNHSRESRADLGGAFFTARPATRARLPALAPGNP